MKKTLQTIIAAAVVVASASAAKADLTINGAVGLPLNPTAQIPGEGGIRVQGNYTNLGEIAGQDATLYGIYAAGRVADNFEVNGGIEKFSGPSNGFDDSDRTGFALGAKYLFTRESDPAGVRIAAGLGYNKAQADNTFAYVVGTKYFGEVGGERVPITGHLGLRYDRFDYDYIGGGESKKASLFAGVEVPITRNGDFSFVGELQSKNLDFDGAKSPYSASVRYRPEGQGLSASLGLIRRPFITNDSGFFFQLGYTFDTASNGQ